jgi:hypothetical protein
VILEVGRSLCSEHRLLAGDMSEYKIQKQTVVLLVW